MRWTATISFEAADETRAVETLEEMTSSIETEVFASEVEQDSLD